MSLLPRLWFSDTQNPCLSRGFHLHASSSWGVGGFGRCPKVSLSPLVGADLFSCAFFSLKGKSFSYMKGHSFVLSVQTPGNSIGLSQVGAERSEIGGLAWTVPVRFVKQRACVS